MRPKPALSLFVFLTFALVISFVSAFAQTERVLYRFGSVPGDGTSPVGALIADKEGNLYGVTTGGGDLNQGTVFELTVVGGAWSEKVLYTFTGNGDGGFPSGGLVFDKLGNLYGTTFYGGANSANYSTGGVVYELSPPATKGQPWTQTVLADFSAYTTAPAGWSPVGGVIFDAAGDLYGINQQGGYGNASFCGDQGCGTVFQLQPPAVTGDSWTINDIHDFLSSPFDGYGPSSLIMGSGGVLYGTTLAGIKPYKGTNIPLPGVVFRLNPPAASGDPWTERILYAFMNVSSDYPAGALPNSVTLVRGHLFGTTRQGGSSNQGVVFELAPPVVSNEMTETVLYNFTGESDGGTPWAAVVADAAGNLYGTAAGGGISTCGTLGCGTVYELTPNGGGDWTETTLYSFGGGSDGWRPVSNLLLRQGTLLGTTALGGIQVSEGAGTVFRLTP